MTTCNLSLRYTVADEVGATDAPPRFSLEPDATGNELHLTATNLRSIDRLAVRWSSAARMSNDGKNPAAVALGRLGGKVTSKAKAEAVRLNGKKGGRPVGAKDSKPRTRGPKS